MSLASFLDRLHARRAEAQLAEAARAVAEGRLARRGITGLAGRALALGILAFPFLPIAAGAVLIWAGWPSWGTAALGAILIAAGLFLLPRLPRMPGDVLDRDAMPETFALLDRIAAATGAAPAEALRIVPGANAHTERIRGRTLIGMGAVLWRAAAPQQRLAILAHEFAHQVNDDPRRLGITAHAFGVLARWAALTEPDGTDDVMAEILLVPLSSLTEALWRLLTRLTYADSQHAEHLADAVAARVAGPAAVAEALELLLAVPEAERLEARFYGPETPRGIACIDALAAGLRDVPAERRAVLVREAEAERHAVDASHPPTSLRLRFLAGLPADAPAFGPIDWKAIDAEWRVPLDRIGDRIHAAAQEQ